eukprot:TRINITY_DN691_c1_g1_i1.p1 TRINITY_DN691_c1_g1~~TRINITY_DN691_c1_g1_i1.p1  ORF type:complete len:186 (+),score=26.62 TRINITY_DN691_c1_g1_i1:81-638(+)
MDDRRAVHFALWKACEVHGVRSMNAQKFFVFLGRLGLSITRREYKSILAHLQVGPDDDVCVNDFWRWVTTLPGDDGRIPGVAKEHSNGRANAEDVAFPEREAEEVCQENGSSTELRQSVRKSVQIFSEVESVGGSRWELPDIEADKYTLRRSTTENATEYDGLLDELHATFEEHRIRRSEIRGRR